MSLAQRHTFPVSHALQLVELASRWDIPACALLEDSGLREEALADPKTRIDVAQLKALMRRARALTEEPGLGFHLGLQKRLTMYGFLGFGAMAATSVREVLELVARFTPTVSTAIRAHLVPTARGYTLEFEQLADMEDVHDVAVFSLLVGFRQLGVSMTGVEAKALSFDVPFDEPDYLPRFEHLLPNARFGQDRTRVHVAARALDVPLLTPDPAALQMARDACEYELAQLRLPEPLADRVRSLFARAPYAVTLPAVAKHLHMSSRTLKRRLANEGVSFKELRETWAEQRAVELMRDPDLGIEEVALELGYASASNFARAFRRWTGATPAGYRKR